MKKFILAIFFLILMPINAQSYNIECPSQSLDIIEKETFIKKITGLNFISKKIVEIAIAKVLNDEFYKSNISTNLEIFNSHRLKNGEFKALEFKSERLRYRALSLSEFNAQTICSYNKVAYANKKIYFPIDLPLKFEGKITNLDLQNVINSEEFQRELKKVSIIGDLKVEIANNFINFTIPIKTFFSEKPLNIKFKANIEVDNNKIVLRNITFNRKSNIINNDIIASLINQINPIMYEINSANGKFCKLFITKAQIVDNEIRTNGVLIINKNISEGNE